MQVFFGGERFPIRLNSVQAVADPHAGSNLEFEDEVGFQKIDANCFL